MPRVVINIISLKKVQYHIRTEIYLLWFGVLLSLINSSYQASTIDSPTYKGAVVEYHPVSSGKDGQTIAEANAKNYLTIIEKASQQNVDIIVFPEAALTSLRQDGVKHSAIEYRDYYAKVASNVPSPGDQIVPCDVDKKYKSSLRKISCAAREHKMYVVVNHHERVDCPEPNCTSDDFLLYNTNVVFDRNGTVIARYRKYNLYNESGTNVTALPEYSTFTTDFGVTFGTFICTDIAHEKPAMFFVNNPDVTDVVFTTHWRDELPFLDSLQHQAAWSYAADVNFLASGFSDELTASGGIGVYAGRRGPIQLYQSRETSNAIVIAEIPKLNRRKPTEDVSGFQSLVYVFNDDEVPTNSRESSLRDIYPTSYQDDLRAYTTRILDPTQKLLIERLCDRTLCCDFHAELRYDNKVAALPNSTQYTYRLAVFHGVKNLMNETTGGLEVCALVACAGERIEDCGSLFLPTTFVVRATIFEKLMITRKANLDERVLYVPSTLTTGMRWPIHGDDFVYAINGHRNSSLLMMSLVKPRANIMTFGLYGRRFDRDGLYPTKPKFEQSRSFLFGVVVANVMILMFFFTCEGDELCG